MRKILTFILTMCCAIPAAYAAKAPVHPTALGEPAALVISATDAKVKQVGDKTVITLEGVNPFVTLISSLHKERVFDNFPTSEFSQSWNNCEKMKREYNVGRADGYNAHFSYGKGEDNTAIASHASSAPLITNTTPLTRVVKKDAGGVKLFVQDAQYDSSKGNVTFVDVKPLLKPGNYKQVVMVAECVVPTENDPYYH